MSIILNSDDPLYFHVITLRYRKKGSDQAYMVISQSPNRIIPVPGLFSLSIAPGSSISGALSSMMSSGQGKTRYICGSFPVILPGVHAQPHTIRITSVQTAEQIIPAIQESPEPHILIEHDASFYNTNADLIRPIARVCRKKVSERRHSVIMLAPRPDGWLKRYEPFVHRYHTIRIPSVNQQTTLFSWENNNRA